MAQQYKHLTPEQADFFLENGYLVIKRAFTPEKAAEWTQNMWVRLNLDPADKSTWSKERIHMPSHKREHVATFAPKAWDIMTELLGGEHRIDDKSSMWGDSFIVNLGTDELEKSTRDIHPRDLDNWHVDGDFFVHYLDSPEQALLVIPVFSEIKPRGGGTYICPEGIDMIARYLAVHPEGVLPTGLSFTPSTWPGAPADCPEHWSHPAEIRRCTRFVEITGAVGDVVLLHPLMPHSASKNALRVPRVITNPPVALRAPFNFARADAAEYSLVERKTLRALGVERLEYEITTERREVVPRRVLIQRQMLEDEKKRLAALASEAMVSPPAQAISVA